MNTSVSLAKELNHFYARFETAQANSTTPPTPIVPADADLLLTVTVEEVRRIFKSVNVRKAEGPDGIPGKVIRDCAYQLADVFTDIFNMSLSTATVPTCLKTATIIPVLKQVNITTLSDYRPVALIPIIAKCLERLVMRHIKSALPNLDQHQYAYRANRSTEGAHRLSPPCSTNTP